MRRVGLSVGLWWLGAVGAQVRAAEVIEDPPLSFNERGCVILKAAEAANHIYDVYDAYRDGDLKKQLRGAEHARGFYAVPNSVKLPDGSPKGYRLRYVLSGRDINLKTANSDLFMGVYESDQGLRPMISFKGSSKKNSDWKNNLLNMGAEQVRDFFDMTLGNAFEKDHPVTSPYLQFILDWFTAHSRDEIILTGHSLGGSLAESNARYFSLLLAENHRPVPRMGILMFNSLSPLALLARFDRGIKKLFGDDEAFSRIPRLHLRTAHDPLQTVNRFVNEFMHLKKIAPEVVLPSERGFAADGTYKRDGLFTEHYSPSVIADIKFAQRANAESTMQKIIARDPRSDEQMRAAYKKSLVRRNFPTGATEPAWVESRQSQLIRRQLAAREVARENLRRLEAAHTYLGLACP